MGRRAVPGNDNAAMIAEIRTDQGGGTPLIYVPGIDGSGGMLLGGRARLAERFRLVCLGYAEERGGVEPTYAGLAASVVERIAELGIARAVLLAESFGGAVALQAALDHPGRVAGLAIVNSFARYPARLRLWLSRLLMPLLPAAAFEPCRRLFAPRALFGPLVEDAAVRELCERRGAFPLRGYRARLRMIAGLDLRPRLREVRQPVALFAGDRDRVVDSVAAAREMARGLPDAELVVIPGGGHLVLPLSSLPWAEWLEKLCERAALGEGAVAPGSKP